MGKKQSKQISLANNYMQKGKLFFIFLNSLLTETIMPVGMTFQFYFKGVVLLANVIISTPAFKYIKRNF